MILKSKYISALKHTKNVFDLLSVMMEKLVGNVGNQVQFITNSEGLFKKSKQYREFVDAVKIIFQSFDDGVYKYKVDRLFETILQLPLFEGFSAEDQNNVVLYGVLKGINIAAAVYKIEDHDDLGPLDTDNKHLYRIYARPKETLLDSFEKNARRRANSISLPYVFDRFVFFDSQNWKKEHGKSGIPRGVITSETICNTSHATEKYLRVGICAFSSERNFKFVDIENRRSIKYYDSSYQKKNATRVRNSLIAAMEKECDLFVLPEYSAHQDIINAVQQTLVEAKDMGLTPPILTFVGSTWTKDGNNVMTIFNNDGDIFYRDEKPLKYYKACPYRDDNITEDLKNPGKQCPFFYIPKIGLILPSICRDVFDTNYTRILASQFLPLLVINSAYTESVEYFLSKPEVLASEYFTSSVVSNYCSARKKDNIGKCVIVKNADKSYPQHESKLITRCAQCQEKCAIGCLFITDFRFFSAHNDTELTNPSPSL